MNDWNKAIDAAINAANSVSTGGYGEDGWVESDPDYVQDQIIDELRKLYK